MNIPNHLQKVRANYTVEELENFELECKKEWESGQVLDCPPFKRK